MPRFLTVLVLIGALALLGSMIAEHCHMVVTITFNQVDNPKSPISTDQVATVVKEQPKEKHAKSH